MSSLVCSLIGHTYRSPGMTHFQNWCQRCGDSAQANLDKAFLAGYEEGRKQLSQRSASKRKAK